MKTFRRILAIARTESRFALRRGAPVVIMALIGLIVGAGIVMTPIGMYVDNSSFLVLTPDRVAALAAHGIRVGEYQLFMKDLTADTTVASLSLTWTLTLLACFLLPLATATSIPADRKFGAGELLHSTPITGSNYLAGKILGVLAIVLLIASVTLMIFFIALEVVFLHFFQSGMPGNLFIFYLELTFLDGLPLLVWGTAIGVLTGVAFPTPRVVFIPSLVMGVLSTLFWGLAYSPFKSFSLMDFVSSYLVQNYHSSAEAIEIRLTGQAVPIQAMPLTFEGGAVTIGIGQVVLQYASALLILFVLAFLARLWLQWKENF